MASGDDHFCCTPSAHDCLLNRLESGDVEEADCSECPRCHRTLQQLEEDFQPLAALLRNADARQMQSEQAFLQVIERQAIASFSESRSRLESSGPPRQIGAYQIEELLGKGGMGAVYRATHSRLKKDVAIKLLQSDMLCSDRVLARFEREMEAVGKLEHPNVVQALDAGEASGCSFLIMELVRGTDLGRIATDGKSLSTANACEIVRQAAVGLQYAHDRGLIHRDVKPANLMLTMDVQGTPVVKVMDLGLALVTEGESVSQLTDQGQLMGTLEFMAPEQAMQETRVDHRADIYALGATLFRLLTGTVPFEGPEYNTPVKRLHGLTNSKAPSIATRCSDLPSGLTELVDRMLSRYPAERVLSMGEVARSLSSFAAGHDLTSLCAEVSNATHQHQESETLRETGLFVDTSPSVAPTFAEPASWQSSSGAATANSTTGDTGSSFRKTGLAVLLLLLLPGMLLAWWKWENSYNFDSTAESPTASNRTGPDSSAAAAPERAIETNAEQTDRHPFIRWAVSKGAAVRVDGAATIRTVDDIPSDPVNVTGLEFPKIADADVEKVVNWIEQHSECTELILDGGHDNLLTDSAFASLSRLTHLTRLSLGSKLITDTGIQQLQTMPDLTRLQLAHTSVTETGLAHLLTVADSLTHFDLVSSLPISMEPVAKLPNLKQLDLNMDEWRADLLEPLSQSRIEQLTIRGFGKSDIGATPALAAIPNLKTLDVARWRQFADSDLASFTESPVLQQIGIRGTTNLTVDGIRRFVTMRPDVKLRIDDTAADLSSLKDLPQVSGSGPETRNMAASGSDFRTPSAADILSDPTERTTAEDFSKWVLSHPGWEIQIDGRSVKSKTSLPEGLLNVTAVEAKSADDDDAAGIVSWMLTHPNAHRLYVAGENGLTNACMSEIARLKQMSWLSFSSPDIDDEGIACLTDMPRLVDVTVTRTKMTTAGLAVLAGNLPQIQVLGLLSESLTDISPAATLPNLVRLDLNLKNSSADLLQPFRKSRVIELTLRGSNTWQNGMEHDAAAMANLRMISLNDCMAFSDHELMILGGNPMLRRIRIHGRTSITSAGVLAVLEARLNLNIDLPPALADSSELKDNIRINTPMKAGDSSPILADPAWKPLKVTASPETMPPAAAAPFDAPSAVAIQKQWAQWLGTPDHYTGFSGIRFRLIPPGRFTMGAGDEELKEALDSITQPRPHPLNETHAKQMIPSEAPQRSVTLTQPFYMGVCEVTEQEYKKVRQRVGPGQSKYGPDCPVGMVSWLGAATFCNQLSALEGLTPRYRIDEKHVTLTDDATGYRLPTEAQWEYACRAGRSERFSFGDNPDLTAGHAWFAENADELPHPVGTKSANAFGLHDMLGNHWEWCEDSVSTVHSELTSVTDPLFFEPDARHHITRGGFCRSPPVDLRSARRRMHLKRMVYPNGGFRVVRPVIVADGGN